MPTSICLMWSLELSLSVLDSNANLLSFIRLRYTGLNDLCALPYAYIGSTFEYLLRANELSAHGT